MTYKYLPLQVCIAMKSIVVITYIVIWWLREYCLYIECTGTW